MLLNKEKSMSFWVLGTVVSTLIFSIIVDILLLDLVDDDEYNDLTKVLEGGFIDDTIYTVWWFLFTIVSFVVLLLDCSTGMLQDELWSVLGGDALGNIVLCYLGTRILLAWVAFLFIQRRNIEIPYIPVIIKYSIVASGVLGTLLSIYMLIRPDFRVWRILYLTIPINSSYLELYTWYPVAEGLINNMMNKRRSNRPHAAEYI
jgi:hypothetical protein